MCCIPVWFCGEEEETSRCTLKRAESGRKRKETTALNRIIQQRNDKRKKC